MITFQEILEGQVVPPEAFELLEVDDVIFFRVNEDKVFSESDSQELLEFLDLIGEEVPLELEEECDITTGKYLISTALVMDPVFNNSIIRITHYNPVFDIIHGEGIIKNHPTTEFDPSWHPLQLLEEVRKGYWEVMDRKQMMVVAKKRKLDFIAKEMKRRR